MIAVIQRVKHASVTIDDKLHNSIAEGLLILLGIEDADEQEDIDWLSRKIMNLRVFNDNKGVMNRSVIETEGEVMVISQFTLHASTKKGNRPSYIRAAKPEVAIPLYEAFIRACRPFLQSEIRTGEFGADMQVELLNDGPVTILIDTKDKK